MSEREGDTRTPRDRAAVIVDHQSHSHDSSATYLHTLCSGGARGGHLKLGGYDEVRQSKHGLDLGLESSDPLKKDDPQCYFRIVQTTHGAPVNISFIQRIDDTLTINNIHNKYVDGVFYTRVYFLLITAALVTVCLMTYYYEGGIGATRHRHSNVHRISWYPRTRFSLGR